MSKILVLNRGAGPARRLEKGGGLGIAIFAGSIILVDHMTDDERRQIFRSCTRFVNSHYPLSPRDEMHRLAQTVAADERADGYGTGPIIENFQAHVANTLGKPSAVFMPSGTMAQTIALKIHCEKRGQRKFALHPTSHLEIHEQHAYRELHGLSGELLGSATSPLSLADFKKSSMKFAAAIVELPARELGGILPSWEELALMSAECRDLGIAIHLDGARLWESAPFYNRSYAEICRLFDSVYVSFYKGLGAIAGAVLAGDEDFIARAKIWQRRQGGNLIHLYPYVVSARQGFAERLPKMPAYYAKALDVAAGLSRLSDLEVTPKVPQTNMMHLTFARSAERLQDAFAKISGQTRIGIFPKLQLRSETSCKAELTVGDATLDLATDTILELFRNALKLSL